MYGDTIIIPEVLHKNVVELLHNRHPGITRMKMEAREWVYWNGKDISIEVFVKNREPCAKMNFKPVTTESQSWQRTECSWFRVHADFFYCRTVNFLIVVDTHSKWIEVRKMAGTDASAVIYKLRVRLAVFGDPLQIVTDDRPPFDSGDFIDF